LDQKIATSVIRGKTKTQDSILTGILGGVVGAISMEIISLLMYRVGKVEALHGQMAGQLFMSPRKTKQTKNFILGEMLHLTVGGFIGLPIIYLLKKTGKDHYKFKGICIGMFAWGALYNGGQKIGLFKKFRLTRTHYIEAFTHAVYGLVTSFAIVKMADPNIFASANKNEEKKSNNSEQNVTI